MSQSDETRRGRRRTARQLGRDETWAESGKWGCQAIDVAGVRYRRCLTPWLTGVIRASAGEKLARRSVLSIARVVAPRPFTLYCGMKSSVDDIRRRFDADVDRFANL